MDVKADDAGLRPDPSATAIVERPVTDSQGQLFGDGYPTYADTDKIPAVRGSGPSGPAGAVAPGSRGPRGARRAGGRGALGLVKAGVIDTNGTSGQNATPTQHHSRPVRRGALVTPVSAGNGTATYRVDIAAYAVTVTTSTGRSWVSIGATGQHPAFAGIVNPNSSQKELLLGPATIDVGAGGTKVIVTSGKRTQTLTPLRHHSATSSFPVKDLTTRRGGRSRLPLPTDAQITRSTARCGRFRKSGDVSIPDPCPPRNQLVPRVATAAAMPHVSSAAARLTLGALACVALGAGTAALHLDQWQCQCRCPNSDRSLSSTGIPSDNFWLADAQGAVWNFGDAAALGSAASLPQPLDRDHHGDQGRRGLLARGVGWRHLLVWRRVLLRLDRSYRAQQAHRRHGGDPRRQGGLAGGVGRRHLQLRRRHILRFDRIHRAQQAHRGHGADPRRQGVLAGGVGRRHLQLRRRHVLRLDRFHSPGPAHRGHDTHARRQGLLDGGVGRGIFNFGDAAFDGSAAGGPALDPAERVVASPSGQGYWVEDQNGTAYPFGDATGSPPTEALMFAPVTPGDKAVLFAFAQLGKPYIWGGNGPVGYDCSGLALASWENGDGVGFARVSDNQYETAGQPVALSALAAGDLVFWGSSQTDWTSVYHTAIYVGGDQIVEATGDHVQLNTLGQWGSGDLMPNGRRP